MQINFKGTSFLWGMALLFFVGGVLGCKGSGKLANCGELPDLASKERCLIENYLAKNDLEALSTPDGLYYIVETEGGGINPSGKDNVKVHYKGYLLDGSVFDSTYDRGETAEFPLNKVIAGWQKGIPMFKKGGKGKLLIPSALAYGERGAGDKIPPNSVLIFDIELLDIKKAQIVSRTTPEQQAAIDKKLIEDYLSENGLSAKSTESGLYYIIDEAGSGGHPTLSNKVTVHYKGTLLDGSEFDSSYKRGKPATFPLNGVVQGWQEGIPLLQKGGKEKSSFLRHWATVRVP